MDKKGLFYSLILVLIGQVVFGQIPTDIYTQIQSGGKYGKELSEYEPKIIGVETISVSEKNPLIIKTPIRYSKVNIYVFTTIFEKRNYTAILNADEHPLKPKLITIDKDGLQLSELQLLKNFGQNRLDYEVVEEIKIIGPKNIEWTTTTLTWTLDQNGQRINDSKKITIAVDKYKITENGNIEKFDN